MGIRKPTLEEWFLAHQLRKMSEGRVYVPVMLELDVTAIAERYRDRDARPPWTAILAKALALTAVKVPEVNRAYVRTLFGDRIIEFSHVSVNVPFVVEEEGRAHLGVTTIRGVDRLTVTEISHAIGTAKRKSVDKLNLTRLVVRKNNNVFWRTLLRIFLFVAFNLPSQIEKRGGGLALTSLLNPKDGGVLSRAAAPGPTAITTALSDVRRRDDGTTVMQVGLGIDHAALSGFAARRFGDVLYETLTEEPAAFD